MRRILVVLALVIGTFALVASTAAQAPRAEIRGARSCGR